MAAQSAGILMYRRSDDGIDVLLVHPGGPFWRNRDLGAWSIPKGEHDGGEDAETAARREFEEELGMGAPGPLQSLGEVRQRAGKIVRGFMLWKVILMSVRSAATTSRLSGLPEADGLRTFPRSIGQRGSPCPSPGKRFLQASGRFSIVLNYSGTTKHGGIVRGYQHDSRSTVGEAF
jgi:predicted NUDIX family NTP pyrophosphohydrolase